MSDWQGAWHIFRYEMRQSWIGILITMLFFAYLSLIMIPGLNELLAQEQSDTNIGWLADFLYLTLLPIMSFLMNRSVFRHRTDDPFTRKLAYLKTMPISMNAIVISRMMLMISVLIPVSAFFFTLQYLLTEKLNEMLSIDQYLIFVFIWIGYSIITGCAFVYVEQAYSGKVYFFFSMASMVLYLIMAALLWMVEPKILNVVLEAAHNREFVWPLLMIVSALGVVALTAVMIRRRLAARDLQH